MKSATLIGRCRLDFHTALTSSVLTLDSRGTPNIADTSSEGSKRIAKGFVEKLGIPMTQGKEAGQTSGRKFEETVADFLRASFLKLGHLRAGDWEVWDRRSDQSVQISNFEQYEHIGRLLKVINLDPMVAAALGADYLITPDVVVVRHPMGEDVLNAPFDVADANDARLTPLRRANFSGPGALDPTGSVKPLLHASVSCKRTLRSDRAQNARSEALNLIRNRKGRVPHIVAITAEPLPSRIASLALGTSDLDCVYHIALPELMQTIDEFSKRGAEDQKHSLETLVYGKRLRDIADLPLDLAI